MRYGDAGALVHKSGLVVGCALRVVRMVSWLCYTEKAREARQRLERQYNTRANRKKQCRPNKPKPYSNASHHHKRENNLTNGHTPSRIRSVGCAVRDVWIGLAGGVWGMALVTCHAWRRQTSAGAPLSVAITVSPSPASQTETSTTQLLRIRVWPQGATSYGTVKLDADSSVEQ